MQAQRHRRSGRQQRLRWSCSLTLLLAPASQAAVFAPGTEPDPATGDVPAAIDRPASEPLRVPGFQWTVAPWRRMGTLSLDGRWMKMEDGRVSRQALAFGDIEWASYLWQPWFLQMRFGLGLMAERDTETGGEGLGDSSSASTNGTLTGRVSLALFPASRFPFEFRADVGDNRVNGDALGDTLRTQRVTLSQSYRPETGVGSLHLQIDHSKLSSPDSVDVLTNVQANADHRFGDHSVEIGTHHSINTRSDTADSTELSSIVARHSLHRGPDAQLDNIFTWNDQRLRGEGLRPYDFGSEVRQFTSVVNWRPREGEPLYHEHMPLQWVGSLRWIESRALGDADVGTSARALSGTLGANLDLTPSWRLAGSLSASQVDGGTRAPVANTSSGAASLSWSPVGLPLGSWRYAPAASLTLAVTQGGDQPQRRLTGLQGTHSLSRDWALTERQQIALTLSQSAAVLQETLSPEPSRALAHSLGLFWQSAGDGSSQRYANLSISDSRTRAVVNSSFQMVNLQLNQRAQSSRDTSWSINLTLQATRNESTEVDAFTGLRRPQGTGWQQFYSGGGSLEQQRLFGVPRLRHTLQLNLNSQQIERRALGDIDAPRERISSSLESRVDYMIGRLEMRLLARLARVDDSSVATVVARLLRRF
ncbi:MAG: hypothetical protein JNL87_13675 [Burkholderiaceae bacterium]|nr:hypothetical protein [Burkholderiaceae bacterium]